MIHFDVPRKPSIEDFGLNERTFLSEKEKENRTRRRIDVLGAIPWGSILFICFCLSSGFILWKYLFANANQGIVEIIIGVIFITISSVLIGGLAFSLVVSIVAYFCPSKVTRTKSNQAYSDYLEALAKYEKEVKRLRSKYPFIDDCYWDARCITCRIVDELLPEAINICKQTIESINIKKEKRWWIQLNPQDFENEVSKWFTRRGYRAKVTKYVGDGGVDIIVEKEGQRGYVQCKRYKTDKVPSNVVRELLGVMTSDGVSVGFIACINGLSSSDAYAFARKNNITVITLDELVEGAETVAVQEINNTTDYVVGPFTILKDVFCSREEALSCCVSKSERPQQTFCILHINGYYMVVHSNNNMFLEGPSVYAVRN